MRNMFNRAFEWEFIENNPIEKVKIKKVKYKETNIYSKNELLDILELSKKYDIMFI